MERVMFVVEKGFRGMFVVQQDPHAARAPKDNQGAWVYKIGATGELKTQTVQPLLSWHKTSATYSDGTELEFAAVGPIEPYKDNIVKVRSLFADSKGRHYFLVGTEEELARAVKNRANLRLGGVEGQTASPKVPSQ